MPQKQPSLATGNLWIWDRRKAAGGPKTAWESQVEPYSPIEVWLGAGRGWGRPETRELAFGDAGSKVSDVGADWSAEAVSWAKPPMT